MELHEEHTRRCPVTVHSVLLGQTNEMFRLQRKKMFNDASKMPTEAGREGESLSLLLNFSHLISLYPQDILVRHLTGAHSSHRRDLC